MDWRNKYLVNTIRIILGVLMVFSGVMGFIADTSGLPEPLATATQVLMDTGIFQMIKITEAVAGLMLIVGFLPWLAVIFLAPVAVGIIVYNAMLTPQFVPVGIVIALLVAYLGYAYWEKYRPLFQRK